ncbi:PH domain-containing protein [Blastopirellula marina]|uniref:YdbS-like PH domain-containing protein n=1 Tax=Blastopirellula marina TaxID=124 RepID=A0A2S8GL98_9BACT|nr:PH domain-containing protein [Blastopirellula marina]PQO45212.1 hypothetical protein C5Y93_14710 [Blastopirellula marina]
MDASHPHDASPNADASVEDHKPDPAEKFAATNKRGERGPDESIWKGGYSAVDQSGVFFILGLATIGLIGAGVFFWPLFIAIPVIWIVQLLRVWWIKMGVAYELTTRRFMHESGVISRTTDRIEVIDIDDVTVEQGIMDRMFNVGTIRITSSDRTHPELRLRGIKDVKKVALMIDDARQAERDRRGVYIESV